MLNYLKCCFLAKFSDEEGQGMVEYALLIGLIALAAIITIAAFGTAITAKFTEITGKLSTAGQ
jgi:pilus assembly protein Flp/PilA